MADNIPAAYVDINYRTAFAFHKARIPACAISGVGSEAVFIPNEEDPPITVDTGVNELVNLLADLYPDTAEYIDYTAWNIPVPGERPQPVFSASLGVPGTNVATPLWQKATEVTFVWRTAAFGIFKLVFLDYPVSTFDAVSSFTGFPEGLAINNYVTNPAKWVRGQDRTVPMAFQQISQTLNEKLRRSYHMV